MSNTKKLTKHIDQNLVDKVLARIPPKEKVTKPFASNARKAETYRGARRRAMKGLD